MAALAALRTDRLPAVKLQYSIVTVKVANNTEKESLDLPLVFLEKNH